MKAKITLAILVGATLTVVLSATAISRQTRTAAAQSSPLKVRTFTVKGMVRGIDLPNKTIRIEHEEIPDYMPAMTMPLTVKESALLNGLASGDAIAFQLQVTEEDSWISQIERISKATLSANSFATKARETAPARESEQLRAGETVPDFKLTDQNGRVTHLSDFKGKVVVLTFIYTRCPLPNFCPLMSKHFASLQERLSKEFPGQFQLLSISIDPQFDTPIILKTYSDLWSKNEKTWVFLTGTGEEVQSVGSLFGLFYEPAGGLINHDLRTALIGEDGKLIHVWKSNVWTPYEVQRKVRETLTGQRDTVSVR